MTNSFLSIYFIYVLGVMLPGADLIVLTKNTLSYGRWGGFLTAFGIATSLTIQAFLILVGLGVLFKDYPLLEMIVRYAGSSYLLFLAYQFMCKSVTFDPSSIHGRHHRNLPKFRIFRIGFLTNFLNVGAILYNMSLLRELADPNTSIWVCGVISLIMAGTGLVWLLTVPSIMTHRYSQQFFLALAPWLQKVGSLYLAYLAIRTLLA